MNENEIDQVPEKPDQSSGAVVVADLSDMIEVEELVVHRLRRWELPGMVMGILFATTMLALDIGVTRWVVVLLVFFSVVLVRNLMRYRRHVGRIAELAEQLAELRGKRDGSPSHEDELFEPS